MLLVPLACRHGPTPAGDARERALRHLAQNQPEAALALLERLFHESPEDLELARALAAAHVQLGRTEALIRRFTALADGTGRRAAAAHYVLGLAYYSRARDATGPAVEHFEKAIALAPGEAELHHRLGVALLEAEHDQRALLPLRRAMELAPSEWRFALPLAKALHRTGDDRGAVEALGRLAAGSPSPAEVATARALMSEIADPFARVPSAVRTRLEQGLTWLDERDVPQQAIITFEEILRDFPDLAIAHALLGLAYQRLDDAGRAVEAFKRAIELAPEDGRNHLYLGTLYASRQRSAQAAEHFQRALALDPFLDQARFQLGDFALERGDLAAAREHFRILTQLQPDAAPPRGKLAAVMQLQGDFAAAEQELKKLLERHPESLEFKLRLGVLHTERYRRAKTPSERQAAAEEATRWLQEVLQAEPENALASRALQSLKAP